MHHSTQVSNLIEKMAKFGWGCCFTAFKTQHCLKFAKIDYEYNPKCFVPTIDVYCIAKIRDVWRPTSTNMNRMYPTWNFPDLMYYPPKLIQFEGMMVSCPAKPKKLLRRYYGKTWKTLNRNFGPERNVIGSGFSF